jgi:nicotinate-nucleotide--dimethylbenzimidazole phosphoribosyltransferase
MAGCFAEARSTGLTVLLDGYVASAAALVAMHQTPAVVETMIAAHLSAEPGHARVLKHLGLTPFLDWNMRLGEGTGGLAVLPLVDTAAAIVNEMATLESWGIKTKGAS